MLLHRLRQRAIHRQGLAWLLWLALLLPLAQSLALAHGVSHLRAGLAGRAVVAEVGADNRADSRADGTADDQPQALHAVGCDLCLSAAAAAVGAPPLATPPWHLAASGPVAPLALRAPAWRAVPVAGYRSRAPPFSLS